AFHPQDDQIARASQEFGLPVALFLEAFWGRRIEYDAGRIDSRNYWHGVAGAMGVEIDGAQLARLVRLEVDFWSRYDERVLAWIRQLREAGVMTGLLSNLPKPLGDELRATGFHKRFDHVTFSHELRMVKPERQIYQHSTEGLGVRPEDALFL